MKTKASRRLVPVHSAILAAGFTRDVLPFRTNGGISVKKYTPAHYWGRRVNGWLREVVGITDGRLSFHSSRHLVRDRLRAARVPEQEQRALLGWLATAVGDRYGLGFPAGVLRDAIEKITY